jgi:hypothetical protein
MYQINTNKLYKVELYVETDFVIEFFDDEDKEQYEHYGYTSYVCWIVDEDGEYGNKCVLHVNYDEAYIEILLDDDEEVSDKQMIKNLTEYEPPKVPIFKNAMAVDDEDNC